ncbi:tyrosine phosphatase family-domain-containing protein [Dissophora ornata]|nr:hypothetical protein BGZ58_002907 [Dissophora ornata]KAI8601909.1 tyrosine phosphatase family-domain-containing protein [Dissophora ornata]
METVIAPGVRRSGRNSPRESNRTHSNGQVFSENIQIATNISDAIVLEDGSITPTAATVITTSVVENGVLSGTMQQDPSFLSSNGVNIHNPLDLASATLSVNTSRSASPNPTSLEKPNVQQQIQQQRQRELHYESANAVLVPPLNFAMVAPGVYRSGHPNKHNFPFMRKLGLRVIVQMSEEPYAPDLEEFLKREDIRRIHYKIEGNKEPFIEIDEDVISNALVNILDARNHPLLIHCAKGKHRIGCLIGCLRKIQNWSMTSIFDEYRRFAGSKVLADQEFIEIFSAKVPYSLENKPFWLD